MRRRHRVPCERLGLSELAEHLRPQLLRRRFAHGAIQEASRGPRLAVCERFVSRVP
jgi:hypothetical protein